MHGTIVALLKRYVLTQHDYSTWVQLREAAGLSNLDFDHKQVYPDEHMYALVGQAARMAGIRPEELQEKLGEFMVPDLLYMYNKLIRPEWKTLEMLEHTEAVVHTRVRQEHHEKVPPVLNVRRVTDNEVVVEYVSARRMGALAVGIIRGLAVHFDEADRITVEPTTREDGQHVRIVVRRE